MEQMAKKRVPVTEEEKQKSYYKYFEQDMAQPAPEAYAKMLNGPLRPDQVLQFKDRNRLFEPGYLEAEAGWYSAGWNRISGEPDKDAGSNTGDV